MCACCGTKSALNLSQNGFTTTLQTTTKKILHHAIMFAWMSYTTNKSALEINRPWLGLLARLGLCSCVGSDTKSAPNISAKMASPPSKSQPKKILHHAIMFVWMSYKTNKGPLEMNGPWLGLLARLGLCGWCVQASVAQNLPRISAKMKMASSPSKSQPKRFYIMLSCLHACHAISAKMASPSNQIATKKDSTSYNHVCMDAMQCKTNKSPLEMNGLWLGLLACLGLCGYVVCWQWHKICPNLSQNGWLRCCSSKALL